MAHTLNSAFRGNGEAFSWLTPVYTAAPAVTLDGVSASIVAGTIGRVQLSSGVAPATTVVVRVIGDVAGIEPQPVDAP
jgi:hypothetical protein